MSFLNRSYPYSAVSPLPKQPLGMTFAAVKMSEFKRALEGKFKGFKITYTSTPDVSIEAKPNDVWFTVEGDSQLVTKVRRVKKAGCASWYCFPRLKKSYNSAPYFPLVKTSSVHTEHGLQHFYFGDGSGSGGGGGEIGHTYNQQICASLSINVGFFQSADFIPRMYFHIIATGVAEYEGEAAHVLHLYAPLEHGSTDKAYDIKLISGLIKGPPTPYQDAVLIPESDGPKILGVQTKQKGYYVKSAWYGGTNYDEWYIPSLAIEEL